MRTVYIGDYFEAELGSGTAFPVFVPNLDNTGLPNKFYLPIVKNGAGTVTPPPANPGSGFYFTHPIHPNQSAITWRMYYAAGQRVAMRISHGPTTSPLHPSGAGPSPAQLAAADLGVELSGSIPIEQREGKIVPIVDPIYGQIPITVYGGLGKSLELGASLGLDYTSWREQIGGIR